MSVKKIVDEKTLAEIVAALKKLKKRIVFTNGCFDLVHAGHVACLEEARAMGDALVVGLNSDQSVREIKGPERPIIPCHQRAQVLAGLESVDYVTAFDEPDPWNLINAVKPDVLVKGGDWAVDAIIGSDIVEKSGGKTICIPVMPDISSTIIIEKIIKSCGKT